MRTFRQVVKEFWVQTLISILWGLYKLNSASATDDKFSLFITNFSACLFLLSWMFGQIIRVRKQYKIEDEFGHVKEELNKLLDKIEKQTKDLIGFSTGGDSIAYFLPTVPWQTLTVRLDLLNISEYPVFDFNGEWIDLDEPGLDFENGKFWTRNRFSAGYIYPNRMAEGLLTFDMTNKDLLRINFFCSTRNRGTNQQFRIAKVNGSIIIAYQTTSDKFKENKIPENFPGYDAADPEKVFK